MEPATEPDHRLRLTPVRDAHRFDESALYRLLAARLDDFEGKPAIQQFEGGQSNPTFRITASGRHWVLRKKPPGTLLRSAHQVEREYRMMRALGESEVPVPRMRLLCEDESVIGTSFFVMDYVPGRIASDPLLPGFSPQERRSIYESCLEVMASLHGVDPGAAGLGDLRREGRYFERQIRRWAKQYEASRTDDIPEMAALLEWLPRHMPAEEESQIVHGDFRVGNCLLHPSEPRVVALLDWELSTLGHPLADLGYFCQGFHVPKGMDGSLADADLTSLGIPDEATIVERYRERSGRGSIPGWTFYVVFSLFRTASIVQGVYKRGLDGNASSESAILMGERARGCAAAAWRLARSAA